MRPAVIFDMDGTLADVTSIRHHVVGTPGTWKDFDAFHAASVDVPPHDWVVDLARALDAAGLDVLVVTARRARWRHHTAWWLALNGVPSAAMFMRGDADGRPDREVKADILARIRRTHDVRLAVDDNPAVVALWRANGIPALVVPGWQD